MVNITDVKQILQFAIDAEIKVFLDGGWGVDALLGHQSRAHNDIDIFVEKNDYQNFIEIMKANGFYEIKMEYTTLNHPEMSFPWNNTITWVMYGLYAIVTAVLLIAPTKKK